MSYNSAMMRGEPLFFELANDQILEIIGKINFPGAVDIIEDGPGLKISSFPSHFQPSAAAGQEIPGLVFSFSPPAIP